MLEIEKRLVVSPVPIKLLNSSLPGGGEAPLSLSDELRRRFSNEQNHLRVVLRPPPEFSRLSLTSHL